MESPDKDPVPLELRLRYQPCSKAGFQLSPIYRALHTSGQARELGEEPLGVILFPKPRLDLDHDAVSLVHEVTVLRHEVPESVPDPHEPLLQRAQLLLELQIFVKQSGRDIGFGCRT